MESTFTGHPGILVSGRDSDKPIDVALPPQAIYLLYEVLGYFPFERGTWSNVARDNCSAALAQHQGRA